VFLGLVPLDIDFQEVDLPSLGQSGTARALRRAGRELVERQFTDGIVARETLALYRAALAGRHGFPSAREIPGKPWPTDAKSTYPHSPDPGGFAATWRFLPASATENRRRCGKRTIEASG